MLEKCLVPSDSDSGISHNFFDKKLSKRSDYPRNNMEVIKTRRLEKMPSVNNGMYFKVESLGDIEVSTKPPPISVKTKIPVLGPTRQDTELYFKLHNKPKERNVTFLRSRSKTVVIGSAKRQPRDGSFISTGSRRTNTTLSEIASSSNILSQKWEEFIDVDSTAHKCPSKSRVLVTRESVMQTGRRTATSDYITDTRWRDMNELKSGSKKIPKSRESRKPKGASQKKVRILEPSKHGFHPRSFSPTFRRLVKVKDKLTLLMERTSTLTDFEEYILELTSLSADEYTESESTVLDIPADRTKAGIYKCVSRNTANNATKSDIEEVEVQSNSPRQAKRNDKTHSSDDKSGDKLTHILRNSTNKPKHKKPVKSKSETQYSDKDGLCDTSQNELHLYLPQIHPDGASDIVSHNSEYLQPSSNSSHPQQTQLPKIMSLQDENNTNHALKRQAKLRKRTSKPAIKVKDIDTCSDGSNGGITRKKSKGRIPSGHKNDVVQDFLNDIPTWVSMTYNSEEEAL